MSPDNRKSETSCSGLDFNSGVALDQPFSEAIRPVLNRKHITGSALVADREIRIW